MTRRIAYVTGSRADYGLFSEPLKRIREHPGMDLSLIVTSMHLEPEFGLTVREIEADGMPVAGRVRNLLPGDSGGNSYMRFLGTGPLADGRGRSYPISRSEIGWAKYRSALRQNRSR